MKIIGYILALYLIIVTVCFPLAAYSTNLVAAAVLMHPFLTFDHGLMIFICTCVHIVIIGLLGEVISKMMES